MASWVVLAGVAPCEGTAAQHHRPPALLGMVVIIGGGAPLQVLPRVLDQITSCKDDLAQLYLMQVGGAQAGRGEQGMPVNMTRLLAKARHVCSMHHLTVVLWHSPLAM